jgi:hypothetical protein
MRGGMHRETALIHLPDEGVWGLEVLPRGVHRHYGRKRVSGLNSAAGFWRDLRAEARPWDRDVAPPPSSFQPTRGASRRLRGRPRPVRRVPDDPDDAGPNARRGEAGR